MDSAGNVRTARSLRDPRDRKGKLFSATQIDRGPPTRWERRLPHLGDLEGDLSDLLFAGDRSRQLTSDAGITRHQVGLREIAHRGLCHGLHVQVWDGRSASLRDELLGAPRTLETDDRNASRSGFQHDQGPGILSGW